MRLKPQSLRHLANATVERAADTLDAAERLAYKGADAIYYARSYKERRAQRLAEQAVLVQKTKRRQEELAAQQREVIATERLVTVREVAAVWRNLGNGEHGYLVGLEFDRVFPALNPDHLTALVNAFGPVRFEGRFVYIEANDARPYNRARMYELAQMICRLYTWGVHRFDAVPQGTVAFATQPNASDQLNWAAQPPAWSHDANRT